MNFYLIHVSFSHKASHLREHYSLSGLGSGDGKMCHFQTFNVDSRRLAFVLTHVELWHYWNSQDTWVGRGMDSFLWTACFSKAWRTHRSEAPPSGWRDKSMSIVFQWVSRNLFISWNRQNHQETEIVHMHGLAVACINLRSLEKVGNWGFSQRKERRKQWIMAVIFVIFVALLEGLVAASPHTGCWWTSYGWHALLRLEKRV